MNEYLNITMIEGLITLSAALYMGLIASRVVHYELAEKNKSFLLASKVGFPALLLFSVFTIFRGFFITNVDHVELYAH